MEAQGVDVTEPGALDRWIEEFNARPFGERDTILSVPEPEPEPLDPIDLPSAEELETMARASGGLARLTAFARYVGEGRKLTQKRNLTLSDGRALAELLDTGDKVDQEIGDRTFKTHSTSDLPVLNLTFRWARAAGFVRCVTARCRSRGAARRWARGRWRIGVRRSRVS